jgi:hypothetical protein
VSSEVGNFYYVEFQLFMPGSQPARRHRGSDLAESRCSSAQTGSKVSACRVAGNSKLAKTGGFLNIFRGRDWRIWLGAVVSVLWIAGGIWYVRNVSAIEPGNSFSLGTVGSFLEGAFAPLAFLWLVLGLFIQQRELADNTEAIRRTSEQSEKQTQAIAATEMNARQESFFKIAEGVKHQLGGISGMLLTSGLGPAGSGRYSREHMDHQFSQAATGDNEIFSRMFISMHFLEEGGLGELLYGTEIRRKHTHNFRRTFERLLRLARNCDVDGIIEDTLKQSAFGLLHLRMLEHALDDDGLTGSNAIEKSSSA